MLDGINDDSMLSYFQNQIKVLIEQYDESKRRAFIALLNMAPIQFIDFRPYLLKLLRIIRLDGYPDIFIKILDKKGVAHFDWNIPDPTSQKTAFEIFCDIIYRHSPNNVAHDFLYEIGALPTVACKSTLLVTLAKLSVNRRLDAFTVLETILVNHSFEALDPPANLREIIPEGLHIPFDIAVCLSKAKSQLPAQPGSEVALNTLLDSAMQLSTNAFKDGQENAFKTLLNFCTKNHLWTRVETINAFLEQSKLVSLQPTGDSESLLQMYYQTQLEKMVTAMYTKEIHTFADPVLSLLRSPIAVKLNFNAILPVTLRPWSVCFIPANSQATVFWTLCCYALECPKYLPLLMEILMLENVVALWAPSKIKLFHYLIIHMGNGLGNVRSEVLEFLESQTVIPWDGWGQPLPPHNLDHKHPTLLQFLAAKSFNDRCHNLIALILFNNSYESLQLDQTKEVELIKFISWEYRPRYYFAMELCRARKTPRDTAELQQDPSKFLKVFSELALKADIFYTSAVKNQNVVPEIFDKKAADEAKIKSKPCIMENKDAYKILAQFYFEYRQFGLVGSATQKMTTEHKTLFMAELIYMVSNDSGTLEQNLPVNVKQFKQQKKRESFILSLSQDDQELRTSMACRLIGEQYCSRLTLVAKYPQLIHINGNENVCLEMIRTIKLHLEAEFTKTPILHLRERQRTKEKEKKLKLASTPTPDITNEVKPSCH
jgi:hypothetical protein